MNYEPQYCTVYRCATIYPRSKHQEQTPTTFEQKMERLMRFVWYKTGVAPHVMMQRCRKSNIAFARHIVKYLAFYWLWGDQDQIAAYFGQERTSVNNSTKNIKNALFAGDRGLEWVEEVRRKGSSNFLNSKFSDTLPDKQETLSK